MKNNTDNTEALILIDIQNMYFTEGAMLLHKPEKAADNAALVLLEFRKQGKPVIHICHLFNVEGRSNGEFLLDFNERVKPIEGEIVISKKYPSSFLETDLQARLESLGVKKLVIAGMMSHMCVDTTTRAAQNYHYTVKLVHDACTTRNLEWNGKTLDAEIVHNCFMASLSGLFAQIVSTEEFLKNH